MTGNFSQEVGSQINVAEWTGTRSWSEENVQNVIHSIVIDIAAETVECRCYAIGIIAADARRNQARIGANSLTTRPTDQQQNNQLNSIKITNKFNYYTFKCLIILTNRKDA